MIVLRGDEESAYRTQRELIALLSRQLGELEPLVVEYRETIRSLRDKLTVTEQLLHAAHDEVDRMRAVMGKPVLRRN
jgi:hypothetical protein